MTTSFSQQARAAGRRSSEHASLQTLGSAVVQQHHLLAQAQDGICSQRAVLLLITERDRIKNPKVTERDVQITFPPLLWESPDLTAELPQAPLPRHSEYKQAGKTEVT